MQTKCHPASSQVHRHLFGAAVTCFSALTATIALSTPAVSAAPLATKVPTNPNTPISARPIQPTRTVVCEAQVGAITFRALGDELTPIETEPEDPTPLLDLPPNVKFQYRFTWFLNGIEFGSQRVNLRSELVSIQGEPARDLTWGEAQDFTVSDARIPMNCARPGEFLLRVTTERIDRWNRSVVVHDESKWATADGLWLNSGFFVSAAGAQNILFLSRVVPRL
jgi:hypothetical protein